MTQHSWRDDADCQYVGSYLFYPQPKDPYVTDYRAAERICASCPVRLECLEDAMAEEYGMGSAFRHGMRGGLSPRARDRLGRERGEPRIVHSDSEGLAA